MLIKESCAHTGTAVLVCHVLDQHLYWPGCKSASLLQEVSTQHAIALAQAGTHTVVPSLCCIRHTAVFFFCKARGWVVTILNFSSLPFYALGCDLSCAEQLLAQQFKFVLYSALPAALQWVQQSLPASFPTVKALQLWCTDMTARPMGCPKRLMHNTQPYADTYLLLKHDHPFGLWDNPPPFVCIGYGHRADCKLLLARRCCQPCDRAMSCVAMVQGLVSMWSACAVLC